MACSGAAATPERALSLPWTGCFASARLPQMHRQAHTVCHMCACCHFNPDAKEICGEGAYQCGRAGVRRPLGVCGTARLSWVVCISHQTLSVHLQCWFSALQCPAALAGNTAAALSNTLGLGFTATPQRGPFRSPSPSFTFIADPAHPLPPSPPDRLQHQRTLSPHIGSIAPGFLCPRPQALSSVSGYAR
jgi:hypothetical protein